MPSMLSSELHLFVLEGVRAESMNDVFDLPKQIESQSTIFKKQLEKHITHKCPEVAVLSAFPIYALDYYGVEGLKRKLEESYEK